MAPTRGGSFGRPAGTPGRTSARAGRTTAYARSRDDGSFVLAGLVPGAYELDADDAGQRRLWSASSVNQRVELRAGADLDGVELVMPATGSLRGRVVDTRGQPVSGVGVVARTEDNTRYHSRTNDAGAFTLELLPTGSVRVHAVDESSW